jgi:hypothetical protein
MGPISVRRVQRDNSWMSKRNASPSYDLSTIDRSIKMGFVRKVYSILATQLLLTCVIIVGFIYGSFTPDENGAPDPNTLSELGMWVFSNASWFILVSLIPIIAIICMLRRCASPHPPPRTCCTTCQSRASVLSRACSHTHAHAHTHTHRGREREKPQQQSSSSSSRAAAAGARPPRPSPARPPLAPSAHTLVPAHSTT